MDNGSVSSALGSSSCNLDEAGTSSMNFSCNSVLSSAEGELLHRVSEVHSADDGGVGAVGGPSCNLGAVNSADVSSGRFRIK